MRKIGFTKYKSATKEVLPKTYKVNDIVCQRQMFCTMINQYLSQESKLTLQKVALFQHSLLSIFDDKILSFFQFHKFAPEISQKIVKIYPHESLVFNNYFKQSKHPKMRFLTQNICFQENLKMMYGYQHPAMNLVQLIFNGKEVEMMLDLNEIFARTIFNRIRKEKDKKVSFDPPYIHINHHGTTTRLYPQWRNVNSHELHHRHSDIQNAFKELNTDNIDQYYLVYPKKESFMQHVVVRNESSDQLIKMIPYSFTFCNKKEKIR